MGQTIMTAMLENSERNKHLKTGFNRHAILRTTAKASSLQNRLDELIKYKSWKVSVVMNISQSMNYLTNAFDVTVCIVHKFD